MPQPFVLLDTNAASHAIARSKPELDRRLAESKSLICISCVTEAELLFGVARRPARTQLAANVRDFLRDIEKLAWDSAAAEVYALLRSKLELRGTPVGALDTMIAAHAIAVEATLITSDKALLRLSDIVTVEDWTA